MLRLNRLIAALWWGVMAGLAFVAVPVIFAVSPEKALAGSIAARIFDVHAYWTVCVGLLLALLTWQDPLCRTRHVGWAIGLAVLAAILNHWAVAPLIVSARATGGNLPLWHGLGSGLVLVSFLAAGWVNWRLSSRQSVFA